MQYTKLMMNLKIKIHESRRWCALLLLSALLLTGCTSLPVPGGEIGTDTVTTVTSELNFDGWETWKPGETDATSVSNSPDGDETEPVYTTVCDHRDEDNDGICNLCSISVVAVLDVYAINDLHGKFADSDTNEGVDELTTYLKQARKADEAAIFLSSGDMWQGSAESNQTHGRIITDWMNALDFAAMTLGNHEFDWGEASIEENAEAAEFPLLAINIFDKDSNRRVDYCKASVIVDMGQWQVGIIGAIGDCYSSIAADKVDGVYFQTGRALTDLVKAEADSLRARGADYIIYTIHDGYGNNHYGNATDVTNAQVASYYDASLSDGYVDLVFEGHTHRRYVLRDGYGVYHLQGGGDNKGISHAEITLNFANGESTVNTAEWISADTYASLADDPLVQELLDDYREAIEPATRVVGTNSRYRSSTELRRLVADLYRNLGEATWGDRYNIVLGGGYLSVRNPYELAAGEVTYATLQSLFPFDNDLVLCSVKGSDLLRRFIETDNSNYYIAYTDYGQAVKGSIDPNATYYIVVDTYTSSYAPNKLTVVEAYTPGVYARDLLAAYMESGGLE